MWWLVCVMRSNEWGKLFGIIKEAVLCKILSHLSCPGWIEPMSPIPQLQLSRKPVLKTDSHTLMTTRLDFPETKYAVVDWKARSNRKGQFTWRSSQGQHTGNDGSWLMEDHVVYWWVLRCSCQERLELDPHPFSYINALSVAGCMQVRFPLST